MRKNITINSTDEEKTEALNKQRRIEKEYRKYILAYYCAIIFLFIIMILGILDLTGVISISWYSRLINKNP